MLLILEIGNNSGSISCFSDVSVKQALVLTYKMTDARDPATVKTLYEALATWSVERIPQRGAFLTPPPEPPRPSDAPTLPYQALLAAIVQAHPSPLSHVAPPAAEALASSAPLVCCT